VAPRLVPTRAAPSVLAARAPHGVLRSGDERAGGAAAVSTTPATGFSARFVGSFCHPRRQCVCRVHDGDARPTTSPALPLFFSLPRAELFESCSFSYLVQFDRYLSVLKHQFTWYNSLNY
jgi:hypothetical protein